MATQGVLSIVDYDFDVRFKIVVGCDGYELHDVVDRIKDWSVEDFTLDALWSLCLQYYDEPSIIILTPTGHRREDKMNLPNDLWHATFQCAWFNPRYEDGRGWAPVQLAWDCENKKLYEFERKEVTK